MKESLKKKVLWILILTTIISLVLFLFENVFTNTETRVVRNAHDEGKKVAEYEVSVGGEEGKTLQIEVGEQEYTREEVQNIFREISDKLDKVVLGENKSFDRVEKNLNLVKGLDGYPVEIHWQLDSYSVMNLYGEIQEDKVVEEGTLIELRGTMSYKEQEAIYVRHARVYPQTRKGAEKVFYEIQQEILRLEEGTREQESFALPQSIDGKELTWSLKKQQRWYYVLLFGIVLSMYLIYREREKEKKTLRNRKEELVREYPGLISKFTMLLGTGTTVRNAWEKIVQNYEKQKEQLGMQAAYEEMAITVHEMQGGVSEAEAYERFGKRCGVTAYIKFGTLLSQNLRKGSKGISDILRMEAIQSFENRKNTAKRLGEEAGTKLLMPMLGMLVVVFIMVMVPAFLSMKL